MRMITTLLALLLAVQPLAAQTVPTSPAEITMSFTPVVKATTPSVVNIYTQRVVSQRETPFGIDPFFADIFRNFGRETPRVQSSLGSGVILTADGIIVSNFHVVQEASQIRVVLTDRREFDAEVLLADEETDLAVLRLKGASGLPALALRDSDEVEVGELVLAIGNPFGVGQTVTNGIISALNRTETGISDSGSFIQTDAAINPGNSGGPLLDSAGRLIGVNTAILSGSGSFAGIGFAVPADTVNRIVPKLIRDGRVPTPGIGIRVAPEQVGAQLGVTGVVVAEVIPGSAADRAGLRGFDPSGRRTGDVITHAAGQPVATLAELATQLEQTGVGHPVTLTIWREGRTFTVDVTVIDIS